MQLSTQDIDELTKILADQNKQIIESFSLFDIQHAGLAVIKYVLCAELHRAKLTLDKVKNYE